MERVIDFSFAPEIENVRMRVRDARWLFDNIAIGTPVRVVRSRGN